MDFLDLLGVPYHAPGVFFLGTDFLFKSILAFCETIQKLCSLKGSFILFKLVPETSYSKFLPHRNQKFTYSKLL